MPTYEYECEDCGYGFNVRQSITAEAIDICPECHLNNVRRLISGGLGVIIKGPPEHVNVPGPRASESRKRRHVKAMEALTSEPMTESEQQAAYEQGVEREKAMGFKPGHAAGNRRPIITSADRDTLTQAEINKKISDAKSEGRKRIAASQKDREKTI